MPNEPQQAPTYKVGDTVYIVESAQIGHLEKYRIDGIHWDNATTQWLYVINLSKAASPTPPTATYGALPRDRALAFRESELTDLCGAAAAVEDHLQRQLVSIQAIIANHCGGTTG